MSWGYGYREYVPVAQRLSQAVRFAAEMARKSGRTPQPVSITGRKIANTFWGIAWCDHMEGFQDYSNRLPRGRTYVKNGSVVDLDITSGKITALVAGSDVYRIEIDIDPLPARDWKRIRGACAASIDSVLDLLSGKFSDGVMTVLTDRKAGLFPGPKEIRMSCSCADWSRLCKHLAAVMYGVGARLDQRPELLFLLRGLNPTELVNEAVSAGSLTAALGDSSDELAGEDLGAMFGIDLDLSTAASSAGATTSKKKATRKKTAKKKVGSEKTGSQPATSQVTVKNAVKKNAVKKKVARKKVAAK